MLQLLFIAGIVTVFLVIHHIRKQARGKRAALTIKYLLYGGVISILLLVITGKMHWLGAAIAAALPLLKYLFSIIFRILPFISRAQAGRAQQAQNSAAAATAMDIEQALNIFGFSTIPGEAEIIQRHRELIQKNHPDRGGSDFLAAQINQAKDVLLQSLKA